MKKRYDLMDAINVLQTILIGLKVTGNSQLSWYETLVPICCEFFLLCCFGVLIHLHKKDDDERQEQMDEIFKNDGI